MIKQFSGYGQADSPVSDFAETYCNSALSRKKPALHHPV